MPDDREIIISSISLVYTDISPTEVTITQKASTVNDVPRFYLLDETQPVLFHMDERRSFLWMKLMYLRWLYPRRPWYYLKRPRTSNLLFLMLFEGGKHGDRCREYHYFH